MFQARWWPWHLLCACIVAALIFLGYWQMSVAFNPGEWHGEDLSIRNFVYAIQWWVFAAFGVWFWFRYMRDQREIDMGVASENEAIARATKATSSSGSVKSVDGSGDSGSDATNADSEPISLDAPADERRRQIFGESAATSDDSVRENEQNDSNDGSNETKEGEK